ncbi:MAG: DUF5318 family protein [Acidimicrobiales bacterium]
MSFLPKAASGAGSAFRVLGKVDYRLARNVVVNEYRKGHLSRLDVCDAHPELLRAAAAAGEEAQEDCPICEDVKLRLVSYVFGPRIPPSGRCVASQKELDRLASPGRDLACYVVEVCPSCAWNHLSQVFSVTASRRASAPPGPARADDRRTNQQPGDTQ